MPGKYAPPTLGADSFSCPHCGALAHQYWFKAIPDSYGRDGKPMVITPDTIVELHQKLESGRDDAGDKRIRAFLSRYQKNEITYTINQNSSSSQWQMVNVAFSRCHSCEGFAI